MRNRRDGELARVLEVFFVRAVMLEATRRSEDGSGSQHRAQKRGAHRCSRRKMLGELGGEVNSCPEEQQHILTR